MDIFDYTLLGGMIGENQRPAAENDWADAYTTVTAVYQAHIKGFGEYFLSSMVFVPIAEREAALARLEDWFEKGREFKPAYKTFWNSLVSLPFELTEGDTFDVENDYSTGVPVPNATNIGSGTFTYTIFTEQLYNDYIQLLGELMLIEKDIMELLGDTYADADGSVTTTTTTVAPTTTTTTTEAPTTTTTTTSGPVYYVYDFTGTSNGENLDKQLQKIADQSLSPWEFIPRLVATDLNVGTQVYYIGVDGDKHAFSLNIQLTEDFTGNVVINIVNGIITTANTGTLNIVSTTPFGAAPTTTTTTTEPVYYIYDGSNSTMSQVIREMAANPIAGLWDGRYRFVALNLNVGSQLYYIGTDGDKHAIPFSFNIGTFAISEEGNANGSNGSYPIVVTNGVVTYNDGTMTFGNLTQFTVSPVITFTKANYGTDVDVVSQYLTLKRGNNQGLFNTNEGSTYGATYMGGLTHLWAAEPVSFANQLANGTPFMMSDIWNNFDPTSIDITSLIASVSTLQEATDRYQAASTLPMVPWAMVHYESPLEMIDKEAIMLDVQDQKFYRVKFTQWTQNNAGGGLSYTRQLIV